MSEERPRYGLLYTEQKPATLSTELDTLRAYLAEMERQLVSMLVSVQKAQGKEPTVLTRAERRGR